MSTPSSTPSSPNSPSSNTAASDNSSSDSPSSTIAFIGLGIMGAPMAAHLVQAGHTVLGVNRSPEPVQRLEDGGRP